MRNGFRHELKYIIDTHDYSRLQHRLARVIRRDPFADAEGRYHVRSLYFDDPNDTGLYDKIDGVENREKYRIRVYNKCDRTIKFEIKTKVDEYIRKQSLRLSRGECRDVLNGDFGFWREAGAGLPRELYLAFRTKLLKPVILVDYVREAYVYPPLGVRVTFDTDLAYGLGTKDLFNERQLTAGVLPRPALIMEIKYGAFLPDLIAALLRGVSVARQAVSKYAMCREAA